MTHLLAKLTPEISSLYVNMDTPHDTSGHSLTASDVADAMIGLAPGLYHLSMLVVLGEKRYLPHVRSWAYGALVRHKWETDCANRLMLLVELALYELIATSRCPSCNGADLPQQCAVCNGIGYIRLTHVKRAEMACMSRKWWKKCWRERYEQHVYQWLQSNLNSAAKHIKTNLRK